MSFCLLRRSRRELAAELLRDFDEVEFIQQLEDRLGAHLDLEAPLAELLAGLAVLFLGEELRSLQRACRPDRRRRSPGSR